MDNTALKESIDTMLLTYDDKGVFTDNDDTIRKRMQSAVSGGWWEEVVVIWADSVAWVWFVWFVSKRLAIIMPIIMPNVYLFDYFVNEIIMIIIEHLKKLDYQRAS